MLISEGIEIQGGGGLGRISAIETGFARYATAAEYNGFFNEFYPATSGKRLVGREVHLGWVWAGATLESEITWFKKFYVENYSYDSSKIGLYCIETRELEMIELPPYEVQKDYNDGVSYFPNADESSFGEPIPIVYGSLFVGMSVVNQTWELAPGLLVDKEKVKFIFACHKVFDDSYGVVSGQYIVYRYVSSLKTYMQIYKASGTSSVNSYVNNTVSMQGTLGELLGNLIIQLVDVSQESTIADFGDAIDKSLATYSTIPSGGAEALALRPVGSASSGEIGTLSTNAAWISVAFLVSSNNAGNRDIKISYINNNLATPAGATGTTVTIATGATATEKQHTFGNSTDAKKVADLPWTVEEVCSLDYYVQNLETTEGYDVRVYAAYLYLSAIKLNGFISQTRGKINLITPRPTVIRMNVKLNFVK